MRASFLVFVGILLAGCASPSGDTASSADAIIEGSSAGAWYLGAFLGECEGAEGQPLRYAVALEEADGRLEVGEIISNGTFEATFDDEYEVRADGTYVRWDPTGATTGSGRCDESSCDFEIAADGESSSWSYWRHPQGLELIVADKACVLARQPS